jgi:hypothetical protein
MEERVQRELDLLRNRFAEVECRDEARWVRISAYPLPEGWNREATDVAFQVQVHHPGAPPYGIYVLAGLRFKGAPPDNYTEPAPNQPPFGGTWGILSWQPEDGQWRPTADIVGGSNLLNWVLGFAERFRQGR